MSKYFKIKAFIIFMFWLAMPLMMFFPPLVASFISWKWQTLNFFFEEFGLLPFRIHMLSIIGPICVVYGCYLNEKDDEYGESVASVIGTVALTSTTLCWVAVATMTTIFLVVGG